MSLIHVSESFCYLSPVIPVSKANKKIRGHRFIATFLNISWSFKPFPIPHFKITPTQRYTTQFPDSTSPSTFLADISHLYLDSAHSSEKSEASVSPFPSSNCPSSSVLSSLRDICGEGGCSGACSQFPVPS